MKTLKMLEVLRGVTLAVVGTDVAARHIFEGEEFSITKWLEERCASKLQLSLALDTFEVIENTLTELGYFSEEKVEIELLENDGEVYVEG